MPPRSTIDLLPETDRQGIDALLVGRGFGSYQEISELLAEQGLRISKSALQRYGSTFQKRCELIQQVTRQAEAIVAASGSDDANVVNDALIRLVQERVFSLLMDLEEAEEELSPAAIAKLTSAVANLGRASVQQKEWQAKLKDRIESTLKGLEQESGKKGGTIDANTLKRVREEVYGLF
jgi:hypothetical protein